LRYTQNQNGFKVVQPKPRKYELFDANGNKANSFDSLLIKGFIEQFEIAHFDRFVDLLGQEVGDSVRNSTPIITLHLTDAADSVQNYYFYKIPEISPEDEPNPHLFPHSLWVFNNANDWVIIQTYTYLLMFREFKDFKPSL
jgi:hypothetical protein